MKNTITCANLQDLILVVAGLTEKGITFTANTEFHTVTILGF